MTDRRNRPLSPATRLAQALKYVDERTGALVPPIQPTATYARDADYGKRRDFIYRRDGNETVELAEAIIADLEEAEACLLFASGMSACHAIIDALGTGDHVVVPEVMYHGVLAEFRRASALGRLEVSHYRAADLDDLRAQMRPGETTLVWVETPNNPDWDVTDIAAAAAIAHEAGARLVTDCTATPPCATRALEHGADISFHSATKYLGGHSDVTAGALSVRETGAFWQALAERRMLHGTVLHSFDAWLLIRGMRTLPLRYARQSESAMKIARHFDGHPGVARVLYPGLPAHPGHEIAKRQTGGQFGGMLSLVIRGGERAAIDVARGCALFYPATSLGGVESLIEHRKTVSGEGFRVDPALLRLSVGIEEADDLIADLEQALARVTG
ncbi:aminotransferase class V-fold PLP-dependent enzyme [Roseovarius sp. SCSIO 43702]|uniref:trans-sulfuration enzyme family protein n=1 Tax=Roseovarius sp. SCSIO 43702 TaxID=2823043 RepID=UPI001C739D9C|nr:aminotransferase class I/II-fold pyridoxal phosphate-dependent enzyme [Roseovarius sp. SCSIO 43702]QYX57493.1 aminotransferase class V-fold PLP-dependent enzyme [Roseovarius sp. SCSIO 43702]